MQRGVAAAYLVTAGLVLGGVWAGLPTRWWPVDVGGSVLSAMLGVAAYGLWRGDAWGLRLARWLSGIGLATGMALTTLLAWTAAHLAGLYGPVGAGGALLLATVAALVLPYLVALPALCLVLLSRARHDASS